MMRLTERSDFIITAALDLGGMLILVQAAGAGSLPRLRAAAAADAVLGREGCSR